MLIHSGDGSSPIKDLVQRIQQEKKELEDRKSSVSSKGSGEEKVEISGQARDIQRVKAAIAELPEVRQEKIEELKQLIQEGRYEMDMDKLADRILDSIITGSI